jgi:hypothetical protein
MDKLLNYSHCGIGIFQFFCLFRQNLLNFSEVIYPDILIPYVLENFSWKFSTLEILSMNEVAKVSSCAARGSMEVAARYRSIVTWLDQLIWVGRGISCCLCELQLVTLLELKNFIVGQFN